jgi:hypothetical protein
LVTGEDFNTKDAIIDSSNITMTDSMFVTVPKHSMVLLTFKGTDLKQPALPLGSTIFGSPVGIQDIDTELDAKVVVYPNPTKNDLNIHSSLGAIDHVKVSSLLGETVFEEFSNSTNITLSMEAFPSGIYLLQIDSNGKSIRRKVIKN